MIARKQLLEMNVRTNTNNSVSIGRVGVVALSGKWNLGYEPGLSALRRCALL